MRELDSDFSDWFPLSDGERTTCVTQKYQEFPAKTERLADEFPASLHETNVEWRLS